MLSKTTYCFQETCHHMMRRGQVYLWTVTFREVMSDRRVGIAYHYFQRDLIRLFHGNIAGVRVFEIHPGGHGLHVHFLCNRFVPARLVWGLSRKHGLGRVDVVRADAGISSYLSKYLGKTGPRLAKGMRRWAAFGTAPRFGVANVKVESMEAEYIKTRTGGRKVPFREYLVYAQEAKFAGYRTLDQTPQEIALDMPKVIRQALLDMGAIPPS